MRDAAGDSGEFYTPRPVIRFMVQVVNPRLGEVVLDPAAGTGGFLVEAFKHLQRQANTVEKRKTLQEASIIGTEPKSLPYLLCQMNLLLHGLEYPRISSNNSLAVRLAEIGDKDRVDVILTNPPFGGEEERGILNNFPADKQTAETALLFLQLIMRKLKRQPKPGRAGVIVPDGILAGDGVCARIKEELLSEFNLHTIIRLPEGVFSPYTDIPTNLIFFDRSGPTKETWYYDHPLPSDRKKYTKTMPLKYEEFFPLLSWWKERTVNERAWSVDVDTARSSNFNLDIKNPSVLNEDYTVSFEAKKTVLSQKLLQFTKRGSKLLDGKDGLVDAISGMDQMRQIRLGDYLSKNWEVVEVSPEETYRLLGVSLFGKGPFLRETLSGMEIKANRLNRVTKGDFIYSRLFAWKGAFGIIPAEFDGCFVSNEFPTYRVDTSELVPDYLRLYFSRPTVWKEVEKKCRGTTKASRNRFKEEFLLDMIIRVPKTKELQMELIELTEHMLSLSKDALEIQTALAKLPLDVLAEVYKGRI